MSGGHHGRPRTQARSGCRESPRLTPAPQGAVVVEFVPTACWPQGTLEPGRALDSNARKESSDTGTLTRKSLLSRRGATISRSPRSRLETLSRQMQDDPADAINRTIPQGSGTPPGERTRGSRLGHRFAVLLLLCRPPRPDHIDLPATRRQLGPPVLQISPDDGITPVPHRSMSRKLWPDASHPHRVGIPPVDVAQPAAQTLES
jgi:hypothetical protein